MVFLKLARDILGARGLVDAAAKSGCPVLAIVDSANSTSGHPYARKKYQEVYGGPAPEKVNREMLVLARELGQPFSLEYALHHTGWLHQHCRLAAQVQAAGDEAMQIARDQGFIFWHASGTLYKAAGLLLQGRLDEGLPLLQKGLQAYRATGAGLAVPYYLSIQGAAQTEARQFASARQALDKGLALVEKNDDRFQEAELYRQKGELLLAESGGVRLHEANAGLIAVSEVMRALLDVRAAGIPVVVLIGGANGCFGGILLRLFFRATLSARKLFSLIHRGDDEGFGVVRARLF